MYILESLIAVRTEREQNQKMRGRPGHAVMWTLCSTSVATAFRTHTRCSLPPTLFATPPRRLHALASEGGEMEDVRRQLQLQQLEACMQIANLEERAEKAEAENDLVSAIEAYEQLLAIQPPTSPNMREQDAARRALQQLLLESARRELEACGRQGCETEVSFIEGELRRAQQIGEESRKQLASRALADVSKVRSAVVTLLEVSRPQRSKPGQGLDPGAGQRVSTRMRRRAGRWVVGLGGRGGARLMGCSDTRRPHLRWCSASPRQLTEEQASEAVDRAAGEQAYSRLVDGEPGWLAGWQLAEATRRRDDARLLRKSVESDLNRLELQLLQGDPSLAFIRSVLKSTRNDPLPEEEASLWLKEQFDQGALPRDPELLRTLLEQARADPDMVVRLVTQVPATHVYAYACMHVRVRVCVCVCVCVCV